RQLAVLGAGTISQNRAFLDALALIHDRLLADAGVLIGTLELRELVDVGTDLTGKLPFLLRAAFHADNDALAIHRIDHAGTLTDDNGAGISGCYPLHAGADIG